MIALQGSENEPEVVELIMGRIEALLKQGQSGYAACQTIANAMTRKEILALWESEKQQLLYNWFNKLHHVDRGARSRSGTPIGISDNREQEAIEQWEHYMGAWQTAMDGDGKWRQYQLGAMGSAECDEAIRGYEWQSKNNQAKAKQFTALRAMLLPGQRIRSISHDVFLSIWLGETVQV